MLTSVTVRPLIQVPNQLVGAPINTDVTLLCQVEASPKAINYWTRENGKWAIFFSCIVDINYIKLPDRTVLFIVCL